MVKTAADLLWALPLAAFLGLCWGYGMIFSALWCMKHGVILHTNWVRW